MFRLEHIHLYVYAYIYIYTYTCIYIYIYIRIYVLSWLTCWSVHVVFDQHHTEKRKWAETACLGNFRSLLTRFTNLAVLKILESLIKCLSSKSLKHFKWNRPSKRLRLKHTETIPFLEFQNKCAYEKNTTVNISHIYHEYISFICHIYYWPLFINVLYINRKYIIHFASR